MENFAIDKIAWYLGKGVRHDPHLKFQALLNFLKNHDLLVENFDFPTTPIPDNFELRANQLTEEGLKLLQKAYQKWLKSIDKGKSETDTTFLEKELKKLRAS
jgi:hypothetical protein